MMVVATHDSRPVRVHPGEQLTVPVAATVVAASQLDPDNTAPEEHVKLVSAGAIVFVVFAQETPLSVSPNKHE
jgi:hypothetical protein